MGSPPQCAESQKDEDQKDWDAEVFILMPDLPNRHGRSIASSWLLP